MTMLPGSERGPLVESRDFVALGDLSRDLLCHLVDLAEEIRGDREAYANRLNGLIMASLFFEPSTRTRLSFEAAMHRLGGSVLSVADALSSSSAAKGETLEDTVRTVDALADIIVLRHSQVGAARRGAAVANAPVINAGDGGNEHPSQTLCDLLTLQSEKGRLDDLTVLVYGDLLFGRTVHSLIQALQHFRARVILVAEPALGLPPELETTLLDGTGYGIRNVEVSGLEPAFPAGRVTARLLDRETRLPGAAGDQDLELPLERGSVDAMYVTRLQSERIIGSEDRGRRLPVVGMDFLSSPPLSEAAILHPLPRVGEIPEEVDQDPRAAFFRQVAMGVPARMAILLWACGLDS